MPSELKLMPENSAQLSHQIPPALDKQVAELIAAYEMAVDKLAKQEKALDENFQACEHFLNDQIDKINALMADLREIMTEAGAARWRLSAQETLRLGDIQLQHLRKLGDESRHLISDSCARFERTSTTTVKNIHEAVNHLKIDEFKNYIEQSYDHVKSAATGSIEQIGGILNWFHWKNLLLALGLSLVVAVIVGLYINDEWPWEMHQDVIKQRSAGKALMNAWPHLTKDDQQFIEQKILNQNKKP